MLLFKQLQLAFAPCSRPARSGRPILVAEVADPGAAVNDRGHSHNADLEWNARELLLAAGAGRIASQVRVQWNPRLRTCAGRADYRNCLITLNPRLREHGTEEIDRTLRHELAHLLAHFRAGRRKIPPHGPQWRQACCDLGIANEARCHHLPFPVQRRAQRYHYRCPHCGRSFPRVRRIRRASACLACCRQYSRGKFDARFRLRLVTDR